MSLTSASSVVQYTSDGANLSFPVPFPFFASGDLVVSKIDLADAETVLVEGVDYSVSGAANPDGGNVLLVAVVTAGWSVRIKRVVAVTQPTSFKLQGTFSPAVHEAALDRLTMVAQQLNDGLLVQSDTFNFGNDASAGQVLATGSTTTRPLSTRYSEVKNAKDFGAVGDGVTNDTAAINAAITAANAAGGGRVHVPKGTYMINADYNSGQSIRLKSGVTLFLEKGAVLQAITNALSNYAVVYAEDVDNVAIIGGKIKGERTTHTGGVGEGGMCVRFRGVKQFVIEQVRFEDAWGDGINIDTSTITALRFCEDGLIVGCTVYNARRNGATVSGGKRITFSGCTFQNTNGTAPQAGMDLEPNAGDVADCITVQGCHFEDNVVYGCLVSDLSSNVKVVGNSFKNTSSTATGAGIRVSADDTVIVGNTVEGGTGCGIYTAGTERCVISGNRVKGCSLYGINVQGGDHDTAIVGNVVIDSGQDGIRVHGSHGWTVAGNMVRNAGVAGTAGIFISYSSGFGVTANAGIVVGNTVKDCQKVGIYTACGDTVIQGNLVIGASQSANNSFAAIRVVTVAMTGTRVIGNTVRKGESANKVNWGLLISSGLNVFHSDNDFTGATQTGDISDAGTTTLHGRYRGNDGALRESFYGTAGGVKPAIAGSRGANAALADLLTKLAALGLITDGTTV